MQYHLKNDHYRSFETIFIGKKEPRAYFIPFSAKEDAAKASILSERYSSDMVRCLSRKEWDFFFIENPLDLPDVFDTDEVTFDKVYVPSCWQFTGYAKPFYLNSRYPFKPDPPHIPAVKAEPFRLGITLFTPTDAYNNIGIYRTFFTVENVAAKKRSLAFLGAISCLDVYLNGQFVGYSEGAHNTAEFDINDYLVEGENELVAVVRRWATATYLECQDMFRNNGIFRDVLLYETPWENILDYELKPEKNEKGYDLSVSVNVENPSGNGVLSLELKIGDATYSAKTTAEEKNVFRFADLPVQEWSAESPALYDLYIGLNDSVFVRARVGFKTIVIKDAVYYLNDAPIKYLGVNHHDTSPTAGYCMTPEEIEKDVRLMKEFNVNAVRTSHYPPDPLFLQLCSEYGLYVVDEADIETHGMGPSVKGINGISNNLAWKHHYLDRVRRMFMRDRNNVCVCMWSLGNESGGYKCQDYCYEYLKKNTTIPVHYEAVVRTKRVAYDVVSEMYTPISFMRRRHRRAVASHSKKRYRPYFLCEYAHAMGVGPGSLGDYYNLFMMSKNYLGGCIWEWADHAVRHEDGTYTYGGDHGEYMHDGNFCVDGLFYPDRTPSRSAYEMKNVYCPITARLGNKCIIFLNKRYFRDTSDIVFRIVVRADEKIISETTKEFTIPPQTQTGYPIILPQKTKNVDILVHYFDKQTRREIGFTQLVVSQSVESSYTPAQKEEISLSEENSLIRIEASGIVYTFDKKSCTITSAQKGGVEFVNQKPINRHGIVGSYTEFFRAPFDNDRNIQTIWRAHCADSYTVKPKFLLTEKHSSQCSLFVQFRYKGKRPIAAETDKITFFSDGTVVYDVYFTPYLLPFLGRIGKVFEWSSDFTKVQWFGRGDGEDYPDFSGGVKLGNFRADITDEEPYIFPQHSGTHSSVRHSSVSTQDGFTGVRFDALRKPYFWTAKPYTEAHVDRWKHREDVTALPSSVTTVDGFWRGVGSNSCGPLPLFSYTLSGFFKQYHFKFRFKPYHD